MKKIILIFILFITVCTVKAQDEHVIQTIVMPTPIIDSSQIDPYSNFCGIVRDMEINCLSNEYAQIENNIWRKQIKIQSEGAQEIEVVFQKFILSPNALISFYTNSQKYQYQGAYFAHKPDSSYISNFLHGDYCNIVIEIPIDEIDRNKIKISYIHHYIESFNVSVRDAKADYSCMIDVNCPEGNDWCDQKRSVAIFYFTESGGRYQCTGVLVNNYRRNFAQYFLTARHCTDKITDWNTTAFYFNYQNSFCNSEDGRIDPVYRVQGSELVGYCDISWSDNALLLMTEPIPIQANVFYAGVDIKKKSLGDNVTCLHHSMGKPKKIVSGNIQNFAGPKWEVYWDNGIIRGGGSGAPVFYNNNKCVIATVSGGFQNLDCSNNLKQEWVGKIRSCVDYSNGINNALFGTDPHYVMYSGNDPIESCQSTLYLKGDFYPTHGYDATLDGLTIQAGNTITVATAVFHEDADFTLTAGNKIVFLPGTKIESGANVTAKISPCTQDLVFCGTHSDIYKTTDDSSKQYNVKNMNDDEDIIMKAQHDSYLFTLHPNPNPGTFQIETNFPLSAIGNLKITNLMGATVYETQNVASHTIQLQNPTAGTFFVVMILKDGAVLTRKMVVQ